MKHRLLPKIITIFQEGYSRPQFTKDLIAGIIVGIVSLPMAIAFAIASGVRPEQGLYTAIVAGLLTSLFGGSRVQIAGPTGAFVILIFTIVQRYGYDGLVLATLMAGIILIVMGIARLGAVIKFIPYPVTIGFTSGIAVMLLTGQIPDLFGFQLGTLPTDFLEKWWLYITHFTSINPYTILVTAVALATILLWPKLIPRIPSPLIAILLTTALVYFFNLPVTTIASRFGQIPSSLPSFHFPEIRWDLLTDMISPAIAVALLAGIESLLSAVVADGMTGKRHRSDMELVAHGIANVGSSLFQGIPSTGAIARTATNVKSGGTTPIAGIVNVCVLALIMVGIGQWIAFIPMATLGAILVITAYNMSEWRHFVRLFSSPKSDVAVLLTTFSLTILVDLTTALEVGIILATFLFMLRMTTISKAKSIKLGLHEEEEEEEFDPDSIALREVPKEVEVFEIYGPVFFAAAETFKDALNIIHCAPRVLILRMRNVPVIDASGIKFLEDVLKKTQKEGTVLLLSGIQPQPLKALKKAKLFDAIGKENIRLSIDQSLERAKQVLALPLRA